MWLLLEGKLCQGHIYSMIRNLFDQYTQPENKITHALVSGLFEDPKLLKAFVKWVLGNSQNKLKLSIVEQRLPGESEIVEYESEKRGLPDAWIYDQNKMWSLIIECKISAPLKLDQLTRHYKTAFKRGFTDVTVLAIDVVRPNIKLPNWVKFISWSEIYAWLNSESKNSDWANKVARYLEIAEVRFTEDNYMKEGTLTTFTGIPFGENYPYNYLEAKRVLKLIMEELRGDQRLKSKLRVNCNAGGRSAITGKGQSGVWDYMPLQDAINVDSHTLYPHCTIAIRRDNVFVLVTMPHGIKSEFRKNLLNPDYESFEKMFSKIALGFEKICNKVDGAFPKVEVVQRHYKSQRSVPDIDGMLSYDLRTAFPSNNKKIKKQPIWHESAFELLKNKKGNTQLAIGIVFDYSTCNRLKSPKIVKTIADTWIACMPFIDSMLGKKV